MLLYFSEMIMNGRPYKTAPTTQIYTFLWFALEFKANHHNFLTPNLYNSGNRKHTIQQNTHQCLLYHQYNPLP